MSEATWEQAQKDVCGMWGVDYNDKEALERLLSSNPSISKLYWIAVSQREFSLLTLR